MLEQACRWNDWLASNQENFRPAAFNRPGSAVTEAQRPAPPFFTCKAPAQRRRCTHVSRPYAHPFATHARGAMTEAKLLARPLLPTSCHFVHPAHEHPAGHDTPSSRSTAAMYPGLPCRAAWSCSTANGAMCDDRVEVSVASGSEEEKKGGGLPRPGCCRWQSISPTKGGCELPEPAGYLPRYTAVNMDASERRTCCVQGVDFVGRRWLGTIVRVEYHPSIHI